MSDQQQTGTGRTHELLTDAMGAIAKIDPSTVHEYDRDELESIEQQLREMRVEYRDPKRCQKCGTVIAEAEGFVSRFGYYYCTQCHEAAQKALSAGGQNDE